LLALHAQRLLAIKENTMDRVNKREFIKYSLLGLGACTLGNKAIAAPGLFKKIKNMDIKKVWDKNLWKWSREAKYYSVTPRGIKCRLCPNMCLIGEGEQSICRTRVAFQGRLYTIAYGNPCSLHVDPVEKKPLYHFYPASLTYSIATAGCNLSCLNCQNWSISQANPLETKNYDLMPEKVVEEAIKNNCKSIAYTYSEPIAYYEYTYDTAKIAREKGIKNILVTAGYINPAPLKDLAQYIDAANVDLKCFDDAVYNKLNAGMLQPVLNTLKTLKENNVWLEITNLIVPGWTDDLETIKKMCAWLYDNGFENYPLHFSRFHSAYRLANLHPTPLATLEKAREIAVQSGLKYVYLGNVPQSIHAHTYCPNCGKRLLERKGYSLGENRIKNSLCTYCKHKISGLWD
jgi:pyruvate formate lyase activating enzyme